MLLWAIMACENTAKPSAEQPAESPLVKVKTIDFVQMRVELKPFPIESNQATNPTIQFMVALTGYDQKGNVQDVLYRDLHTEPEFDDRIQTLNFGMQSSFYLKRDEEKLPAQIVHFESNYHMKGARIFIIGFSKSEYDQFTKSKTGFDFVFQDEVFGLGTSHFSFSDADIQYFKTLAYVS